MKLSACSLKWNKKHNLLDNRNKKSTIGTKIDLRCEEIGNCLESERKRKCEGYDEVSEVQPKQVRYRGAQ